MSKFPYKDRPIAEQVALVIDDLLYAVENNKPTISRQIPIINKVKKNIEKKEQEDMVNEEKRDLKIKQRHQETKQNLEKLKKDKEDKDNEE